MNDAPNCLHEGCGGVNCQAMLPAGWQSSRMCRIGGGGLIASPLRRGYSRLRRTRAGGSGAAWNVAGGRQSMERQCISS